MTRSLMTIFATLVTLVVAATPALADEGGKRERVREKVRAYVVASLIERLDLDETTTAKLMPILKRYHEQMAGSARDVGDARHELKRLIDSGRTDDAAMNKLIDRMLANRAKVVRLEEEMYQAARKVLSPVVFAKLVIVLPQIKRQVEKTIRKAARERKGEREDEGDGD